MKFAFVIAGLQQWDFIWVALLELLFTRFFLVFVYAKFTLITLNLCLECIIVKSLKNVENICVSLFIFIRKNSNYK